MRHAVVERGRRSWVVRFDALRDRLWRATDLDTVRNMAMEAAEEASTHSAWSLFLRRAVGGTLGKLWQSVYRISEQRR